MNESYLLCTQLQNANIKTSKHSKAELNIKERLEDSIDEQLQNVNIENKENSDLIDELNVKLDNLENMSDDDDNERSVLFDIENAELLISTKEMVDSIKLYDSSIEIVGVAVSTQDPKYVQSKGITYQVFNFTLQCVDGTELTIAVWDEDISRIHPHVSLNHIIHVDGAHAKPQKPSKWNCWRDFTITCRSNTIVNNLGISKRFSKNEISCNLLEFNVIEDCIKEVIDKKDEVIALKVYIKTEFRNMNENNKKKIGVVTDLKTKINVYVCNFDKELGDTFKKGCFVKMIGKLIEVSTKLCFEVSDSKHISILEDKNNSEIDLVHVTATPKRPLTGNNVNALSETAKKLKFG